MRTVKSLIEELKKFPEDAVCFAYEGEDTGIVVEHKGKRIGPQGVIHCSESNVEEPPTVLLDDTKLQEWVVGGRT